MPFEVSSVSSSAKKSKLNYPARSNIKIHVLRNGISSFKGIWFPIKITNHTTLNTLLMDLSIALKYKVFIHKGGVQSLFSADGCKVKSLEELHNDHSYIATCVNETFKHTDYQLNSRPSTAQQHLSVKQPDTPNVVQCTTRANSSRKCDSLVGITKTASQKPSNIKLGLGSSSGNLHPPSSKSLQSFSRKIGKLTCNRRPAPKVGLSFGAIVPVTVVSVDVSGSSSSSKATVNTRASLCDKTGSSSRLRITPMVTKTGRSASATPTRSRTIARELSTSGPTGNVALERADAKPNDAQIPQTTSSDGNRKIFSRTRAQSCRPSYNFPSQWITVVRFGKRPRTPYRILLDHTTTNFTSVMNKIIKTLMLAPEAKVFSNACAVTSRYEDFFQHNTIFLAFPSMSVKWKDLDLNREEEQTIERQSGITKFGLMTEVRLADLPKCISSSYDISNTISYGCYSLMIHCYERSTKRKLVLKVVHKRAGNEFLDASLKKNRTGVKFLSLLKHSNILSIFLQSETVSALYIIVDYCNGGDLHKFIERSPRILEKEAWNFIGDIMSALRYLHSVNIVYRFVSAPCVMVNINHDGSHQLKLNNFNIATRMTKEPLTDLVGFLLYMAPEMIVRKYGLKVDVWGAGITLYFILTRTMPFLKRSVEETRQMILSSNGVSFEGAEWTDISLSCSMKSLICGMLEFNENHRLSAEDLCDVISKHDFELDINLPTEEKQEPCGNTTACSEPIDDPSLDDSDKCSVSSSMVNCKSRQSYETSEMQSNSSESSCKSHRVTAEDAGDVTRKHDVELDNDFTTEEKQKALEMRYTVFLNLPESCSRDSKIKSNACSEPIDDSSLDDKCSGISSMINSNSTQSYETSAMQSNSSNSSESSYKSHRVTAKDAGDVTCKHDVEFGNDLTLEEQTALEMRHKVFLNLPEIKTSSSREPKNINVPSLVQNWISSSNFVYGDSKLREMVSERSYTSESGCKSSNSSIELSCMSLLSSNSSCSYTCERNEVLYDSCCDHIDTGMCDASEVEGSSTSGIPNDLTEYYGCPRLEMERLHDTSETEAHTLDSEEDEHHEIEAVNHQRTNSENVEAIVLEGFGNDILIQVGVLQSIAYKDCTTSETCPGTVVGDEDISEFRRQGFHLLQQKANRDITDIPSDLTEDYGCPRREMEHWPDMSETEAHSLDSVGESEHREMTVDHEHQNPDDINQGMMNEHLEAVVFQGFGEELVYTIPIQVGVVRSDAYKDPTTREASPGTIADVNDFRRQGYNLLRQITEREN